MSYILEFKISQLPDSPNKLLGAHWTRRKKHADKWLRLVWAKVLQEEAPPEPLKKAKLTLVRYSTHKLDSDNLRSSFKAVVDALVKVGVIVDDDMDVIGEPEVRQEPTTRENKFIYVKVEEIRQGEK